MRRVIFIFLRTSSVGGGGRGGAGGGALPDFFFFSCSADHERDCPPCKVVFFGLATNTLNVRNNNNHRRVSTYRLNRENSRLAASLEAESGPEPAENTIPHSYRKTMFRKRGHVITKDLPTFSRLSPFEFL